MALLDVSEALTDPDVLSAFTITRRPYAENDYGEPDVTPTVIPDQLGVVCYAGPDDLDRLPEEQRQGKVLSIVTKVRLYGANKVGSQQYQPDLITWQGNQFIVQVLDPYTQYGSGFVQAICPGIDAVDEAPA